eukprot:254689_1
MHSVNKYKFHALLLFVILVLNYIILTLFTSNDTSNTMWFTTSMVTSFKEQSFYNNSIRIGVPALIIAGPPKTGTSTLLHAFFQYPDTFCIAYEHFYWASHRSFAPKFECENYPISFLHSMIPNLFLDRLCVAPFLH